MNLKNILFGNGDKNTEDGTERLVPVKEIYGEVIALKNGKFVTVLEVLPLNFHLKSELEQKNIISGFAAFLKTAPDELQIIVETRPADISAFCERLESYYNAEKNTNCRQMIFEDAQLVNFIAETEGLSRRFYIVLPYTGQSSEIAEVAAEIGETALTARQYLEACGLETVRHSNEDEFLINLLRNYFRPFSAAAENSNMDLSEALTPDSADCTGSGYICIEGEYRSYLYISGGGYPTTVGIAWGAPFVEAGDGINISFVLKKESRDKILPKIGNTAMFNRSRLKDVGDTRQDFEQLDDAVESGLYMKSQINREGEDFYYLSTVITVTADSPENLKKREKDILNLCGANGFSVRKAYYMQDKAFLSSLPLLQTDTDIFNKSKRNILTSSAAALFPFSSFEMCDEKGIFYGLNLHNSSPVIIDHYDTSRYSNGNMAVFGMSGAGKTFFLLLLAMRLRMQGVRVYIIAPEKGFEYRNACEAIGGKFVSIGAGSSDCINLMEIRRTTLDIDSEMQGNRDNGSVLLDKIQSIHIFFDLLYPAITPDEKYLLDRAILNCYKSFGITRDNRSLTDKNGKLKKMPCFADLIPFMEKFTELKAVTMALKRLVEGSASGLGGQTNIDLKAPFIVLDTSRLSKEFTALGTFIATEFVRDRISVSRVNKKAVILDEAWKIAGENGNEQAADFVINLIKTVRGYGAIFVSATQNVVDYFALNDGKFGDALLGNSRLKLLLQIEETEAVKLQEKLMLTESETAEVIRAGRGEGLLCAGRNRIAVEIRSSDTEFELITTDRESLAKRVKTE